MTIIISIGLVLSTLMSMSSKHEYPGAIMFSVTMICATVLTITGNI